MGNIIKFIILNILVFLVVESKTDSIDTELISFYNKNKEYNCTLDIPKEDLKEKSILTQYGVFIGTIKEVLFFPMSVPYGEWSLGDEEYECYLDNKYTLIKKEKKYTYVLYYA